MNINMSQQLYTREILQCHHFFRVLVSMVMVLFFVSGVNLPGKALTPIMVNWNFLLTLFDAPFHSSRGLRHEYSVYWWVIEFIWRWLIWGEGNRLVRNDIFGLFTFFDISVTNFYCLVFLILKVDCRSLKNRVNSLFYTCV